MNRVPLSHIKQSLLVALIAGIGMFLIGYSTRWGAGLISDTFQYVASARNFAAGNGFSIPYGDNELEPMTKYPPLFSVVLAVFEFAGVSALLGTRFINIFLFGANAILVFLSVRQRTDFYWSLLASLLFSISFVLIEIHSWALSEPLYIFLGLCTILLSTRYFKTGERKWLIVSALLAASVVLTRYVGLSLVLAVILVILLNTMGLRRKVADALLFGSIAILPVAIWTWRGYLLTATLNDRVIQFHPLTKKNYTSAIDTIYGWFLPRTWVEGNEKLLLLLSAFFVIGLLVFLFRAYRGRWSALKNDLIDGNEFIALHVTYLFTYGIMIIVSKTWVDADIGLSDRILSPMLASLLILLSILLSFLWSNLRKARVAVALIAFALIAYYLAGTVTSVQRFHQGGIGIARRGWNRSEAVQALRSYSSFSIYTNSNSSLYLWSDRAGYSLPDFEQLREKGTDKEVLLVIFRSLPPGGERLNRLIDGLDLIIEDQIVSIYAFDSGP